MAMNKFEKTIHDDLHRYLMMEHRIDNRLPKAEDIEGMWKAIGEAYLPDGIREYNGYPTVSLGWMMYTGMAVAQMWDEDWTRYSALDNIYLHLRDKRGYDCMDEYILEEVLKVEGDERKSLEHLVAECAARTHSQLYHGHFEPGTREAFHAYVCALHQLYLMGAAVRLKALGYKMTPVN